MAGVKVGGARTRRHTEWYKKGTDEKVIRVICPKGGYGTSYWAVRKADFDYEKVEMKDMEKR